MSAPVYAEHAYTYAQAGWPCVIPVPMAEKFPPPVGFTGAEGRDTTNDDLARWAQTQPGDSIALRMPMFEQWGVIGIDVDSYVKAEKQKYGAETLAVHEQLWGQLPPTWTSTARGSAAGPGISGIRFFRVPAARYATVLRATHPDGSQTSDVEIIQRHHRYAVVWPSPNHGAGADYRWYDPRGVAVDAPPKLDELTWLPQGWVDGLAAGATPATMAGADRASGESMLDQLTDDFRPQCADVVNAQATAVKILTEAESGSRHERMAERTYNLVLLGAAGHPGVGASLMVVRDLWATLTAGEDREGELNRAVLNACQKAVTAVGLYQVPADPCALMAGGTAYAGSTYAQQAHPAPSPGDPGTGGPVIVEGVDLTIVETPRWVGIREFIGAHAFDPSGGLDQPLAEAVLERTYPALRYAYDTKGWLLRTSDRWELHGKMSGWAVAQVAGLMPHGDPEAEKGHEDHDRAKRRARLMTTAGARAIAGKMDDLVVGGMHPVAVKLGDLDSDPEVVWAGSRPWDLRASYDEPRLAAVDPATPHLHSAAIVPAKVPTPHWDAFLASVWPDPELRAWAMRVLSISLTGYSDRALPILLGETGRGKTQVVALLMSVMGTYAHAANPKLLSPNANEHDTIVFDLKGRRLSFIDEAPSEAKAGQERLKQLTGGGDLTGRQMNQDPVTFAPSHTFVLTSNEPPSLTDAAVRSRIRLIPCTGDPELVKATRAAIGAPRGPVWRSEAPGVLAALMAETAMWLADASSAAVSAAPENIRYLAEMHGAEQDPVTSWVMEECEVWEPGTQARELYQHFTSSCLRSNMRKDSIPTMQKWGRTLTQLGYDVTHTRAGKLRKLRVRPMGTVGPDSFPAPAEHIRHTYPSQPQPEVEGYRQVTQSGDGYQGFGDGSVTASGAYPSQTFSQVSLPVSSVGDGCDGYIESTTHIHARAHTPEPGVEVGSYPSQTPQANPVQTLDFGTAYDPSQAPAQPAAPKPKRTLKPCKECGGLGEHDDVCTIGLTKTTKAEEAKAQRAAAASKKRAGALAEAAGPYVGLPAVVTRDGSVRPIGAQTADTLLATITAPSGHGELTVDVEHTGYPIGHRHYALRTIQLGDETFAVVLDANNDTDTEVARRHLAAARELHAHSAGADITPLAVAGLLEPEEAWGRMIDTGTLAKIADPAMTGNNDDLKNAAKAMLGDTAVAPEAAKAKAELFKAGGWLNDTEVLTPLERSGWAQVDHGSTTMLRYDGSDVLDCAAIARRLPALAPDQLVRERTAQRMTARVGHTGFRFNPEQVDRLHHEHSTAKAKLASMIPVENPGSNDQVAEVLARLGAQLPLTATGKLSVAKGVIEPFAGPRSSDRTWAEAPTGDLQQMAQTVLDWRHHKTALALFLDPWRDMIRNGDGRARSTVHTLGADTGRMCLPIDHRLLTRLGWVNSADVREGMETLDDKGRWVRVKAVHRYNDQPVYTLTNRSLSLAATAEHRWVTSLSHAASYARRKGQAVPARELRKLDDRPRLRIHLAPEVEAFDFDSRTIPAETDAQRFAALVGMLVTDGRCTDPYETRSVGMRAYVYQTEGKFYDEFMRVIPTDAVMYDRVTANGVRHHEIRVKARWLRARLDQAGLRAGDLLKESADLHAWVAGLPEDELRAFFAACWLSDGSLGRRAISCGSENLRNVLTLAAYRLGYVAHTTNSGRGDWSTKDRLSLNFREPVLDTERTARGAARSDVWCVTTETGTFTAGTPGGTAYLTGNSSVRWNLQQLSREGGLRACIEADPGWLLITADFASVEIRVGAALSQDQALIQMLAHGVDLHAEIAKLVWGPGWTKANRYLAKRKVFGRIYGQGIEGMAKTDGAGVEVAKSVVGAMDAMTPGLTAWSSDMRGQVDAGRTQWQTYAGRVIHLPKLAPHAAANYGIQGTARELLIDALVAWDRTRWGGCTLMPVHDEVLAMVPEDEADAATETLKDCMATELNGVPIVAEADAPSFFWRDSS